MTRALLTERELKRAAKQSAKHEELVQLIRDAIALLKATTDKETVTSPTSPSSD